VLASIIDISQRKRAEEELKHTATELGRSNANLQQFAYVASHDLQEPLRAVAGCMDLLRERYRSQLEPRAQELIDHAVDGAMRMQTLIDDLLGYSRVGSRGQVFEPVDLVALLKSVLANLTASIQKSGAEVSIGHLPTILADPTQMIQLFQNLISNAIKFRQEEAPRIHIAAKRIEVTNLSKANPDSQSLDSKCSSWMFSVQDNGIGMEPQYFERIFGIFQRLHSRRVYPGTGIGLAICKKIIERHGGSIWVESELGKGTTFFFTLPDKR
jgi:light-regulated signal transduction histidine kinase (bacteriophytochrome)